MITTFSPIVRRPTSVTLSQSLPPFGSRVALNHEFTLDVRSILFLPLFTFSTKLIHFTGINGAILLSTWIGNDSKAFKVERTNPIFVL